MGRIRSGNFSADKQADFQQVMKDEKAGRTIV
jgi:hypothetical protein